jgi:hypothetical protein
LIWLSFYYFTFEMLKIKLKIVSLNSQDYHSQKRRVKIMNYSVLFIATIIFAIYTYINWFLGSAFDYYCANYDFFSYLTLGLKGVKLIVDCIIYALFIHLLRFFYQMKIQKLRYKTKDAKLSAKNRAIFAWIIFIMFLTMLQSILSIT